MKQHLQRLFSRAGLDATSAPSASEWPAVLARLEGVLSEAENDRARLVEESLARAEAVMEAVADGIMVVTEDLRVAKTNRRFHELWQLSADLDASQDAARILDHIASLMSVPDDWRAKHAKGDEAYTFDDIELKDGRLLERFVGAVRSENGVYFGSIFCFRDVTAQRKLASDRRVLAERMASMGRLVASVAHEINNPLAYITLNLDHLAEVLREAPPPEPDVHGDTPLDVLAEAQQGVVRVAQIVRDLRALSRADEDRLELVDLQQVMEVAIQMAMNDIRHRAKLVRRFDPIPKVLANSSRLGQVFLNLLVNASHAIPEGRASQNEIVLTISREGPLAIVTVHDTGDGIAEANLPRVFDPFFTTKAIGDGTGLGLSICKGIVEGLGGTIVVDSALGAGTTFTISLPIAPVTAPRTVTPSPTVPLARGKILVIDDEEFIQRVVKRSLRDDHDVEGSDNAARALELLREGKRFDLILCDLMMPEMTGADFYEALQRELPELTRRVIFMTGGVFAPGVEAFIRDGAFAVLQKPIQLQELRRMIRTRLG